MKKITILLFVLFVLTHSAMAAGRVFESTFKWDPLTSPRIIIYASINDSDFAPFIFDTGTSVSVIVNSSYPGIKVNRNNKKVNFKSTDQMDSIERVKIALETKPQQVVMYFDDGVISEIKTLDMYYGKGKIAGIIGAAATQFGPISFDFNTRVMKFGYQCEGKDIFDISKETINIKYHKPEENGYVPQIPISIGQGYQIYGVLDSGADTSLVGTTGKDIILKNSIDFQRDCFISNRMYRGYLIRAKTALILNNDFKDINIQWINNPNYNLIGMDFISQFNFVVDYKNKVIHLNKRNISKKNRADKGFEIQLSDKKLIVTRVSERFTGSEVLKPGDEILYKDEDFTKFQWDDYLNGWVGDTRTIQVKRGSRVFDVAYKCKDIYE